MGGIFRCRQHIGNAATASERITAAQAGGRADRGVSGLTERQNGVLAGVWKALETGDVGRWRRAEGERGIQSGLTS